MSETRTLQADAAPQAAPAADAGRSHPIAGLAAGLVAGVAFLLAQMSFAATWHGGSGVEPLLRIGAILLGPDAAPPTTNDSPVVLAFGLLIHLTLAALYGRLVEAIVRDAPLPIALRRGALIGVALYAVNYWLLAPAAFPWFTEARGVTTIVDHVLFGVLAAALAAVLRVRLRRW